MALGGPTTKLAARHPIIKTTYSAALDLASLGGSRLFGSETMDFGSISANTTLDSTGATVTGAAVGDVVAVSGTVQTAGLVYTAYVSATDTIKTRVANVSAGAIDPASQTLKYVLTKPATNVVTGTVTVTGAALGDYVIASLGVDVAGLVIAAYVSAADTVTYVVTNTTGAAVDLASATFRLLILDLGCGL
jgi:hypothetical protein